MKVWPGWLGVLAWAGAFAPGALAPQDRAAVQAVRVAPDSVELGDSFTLRASVHVPPGRDLRVPATLLSGWGVESLRRVRTDVVEAEDGSLRVVLEYDLIALEIGLAATPELEMTSGEMEAGGDRMTVEDAPEGSGGPAGGPAVGADERPRDRLVVSGRRVFVTSPVLLDDIARGLRPRPPADVVGASWSAAAVLGGSLLSLLLLGVGTLQARAWLAARAAAAGGGEAPPETPEEWRERALAELDRLIARGHHRAGRLRDFYEGAGDVVRAYVAHFNPAWNRSRTTTELMRDVSAEPGWPDAAALARAMGRGEVAKFAATRGVREGAAATAERDGRTMRAWVDATGRAPVFTRMREAVAAELDAAGPAVAGGPGAIEVRTDRDGSPESAGAGGPGGADSAEGPR